MIKNTINLKSTKKIRIEAIDHKRFLDIKNQVTDPAFYQYAFNDAIMPINSDRTLQFLAFTNSDTDPIGYMQIYLAKHQSVVWIQSIAIAKNYLRQGFGSAFVKEVLTHTIVNSQLKKVMLSCHQDNVIGIKFWHNLGFTTTLKKDETQVLIMTLNLKSNQS